MCPSCSVGCLGLFGISDLCYQPKITIDGSFNPLIPSAIALTRIHSVSRPCGRTLDR